MYKKIYKQGIYIEVRKFDEGKQMLQIREVKRNQNPRNRMLKQEVTRVLELL